VCGGGRLPAPPTPVEMGASSACARGGRGAQLSPPRTGCWSCCHPACYFLINSSANSLFSGSTATQRLYQRTYSKKEAANSDFRLIQVTLTQDLNTRQSQAAEAGGFLGTKTTWGTWANPTMFCQEWVYPPAHRHHLDLEITPSGKHQISRQTVSSACAGSGTTS